MKRISLYISLLFFGCTSSSNTKVVEIKQTRETIPNIGDNKISPCDIHYDTINHVFVTVINLINGKGEHKLVEQDLTSTMSLINPNEKEPYKTLTNIMLNSLLEKDPYKFRCFLFNDLLSKEQKDYVIFHLKNPICRELQTKQIIDNINKIIAEQKDNVYGRREKSNLTALIEIVKNVP